MTAAARQREVSGKLARRHRIAQAAARDALLPQYILSTSDGRYLHESVTDGAMTPHRAHAWRGTRERMRAVLDAIPERTRKLLKPICVAAPKPAGRAR